MCKSIAVHIANIMSLCTAGFALAAIISYNWLETQETTDGTKFEFGVVTFRDSQGNIESYGDSLSEWPSEEWAAAYVLMIVALIGTAAAIASGLVACCMNCCCLCCLSFPFSIISSIISFITFIMYWTAVMLFASRYHFINGYDLGNGEGNVIFCPNSSDFKTGDCSEGWGLWCAVIAILGSFVAMILYGCAGGTLCKRD
eukprot:Awhi_evm1s1953